MNEFWPELIRRWDTRTWRDVVSYMITYFPLNYDTPVLPEYLLSNAYCYISNGHKFTKSALPILLLSNFHLSSINYSLVCSLPIHTGSSANAEHTVSWNRVKCCTNVRQTAFVKTCNLWMTFKVIRDHCRCCHFIGHIRFPISLLL